MTPDEKMETWLRNEVAPAYDRMQENPACAIPAQQVFAALTEHHQALIRKREAVLDELAAEAQEKGMGYPPA